MATKKAVEPKFEGLAKDLATADAKARAASGDASQARAERSTIATDTIKAAYAEKIDANDVRTGLLGAGVLKGTVSKIVTILNALNASLLTTADVKSLNGAYSLIKQIEKTAAAAAAAGTTGATAPTPSVAVVATTPDEALDIIIDAIRAETDLDKQFELAGIWMTKITDRITAVTKEHEEE